MVVRAEDSQRVPTNVVLWRSINFFMFIFLVLATYVQINDDDNYLWIPVYLIPAGLCLLVTMKPALADNWIWRIVCAAHSTLCLALMFFLVVKVAEVLFSEPEGPLKLTEHREASKSKNPLYYEEGRELLGVVITFAWLKVINYVFKFHIKSPVPPADTLTSKILLTSTAALSTMPLIIWGVCIYQDVIQGRNCLENSGVQP